MAQIRAEIALEFAGWQSTVEKTDTKIHLDWSMTELPDMLVVEVYCLSQNRGEIKVSRDKH